jgi:hypothetical protein
MIFPDQQSQQPDGSVSEPLRQTLHLYYIQCVLPLEQQYYQLLSQQFVILNQLQQQVELEPELRDELAAWIIKLRRTLNSHQFGDKPLPNEFILWALFGANSQEGVKYNIGSFCLHRTNQVEHIRQTLAEIASESGLKRQLKRRRRKEPHIARFLDEWPRIYANA